MGMLCFSLSSKAQLCLQTLPALASANHPTCVASADFNNDGKQDLIVGRQGGADILLGNGQGAFTTYTTLPTNYGPGGGSNYVRSVTTCNLNNDAYTDVVFLTDLGHAFSFVNSSAGTFSYTGFYSGCTEPLSVLTADFNNDNQADLIITDYCSPYFHRYLGNGTGGFSQMYYSPQGGSHCYGGTAADFNNDGNMDLALSNQMMNGIAVFMGTGTGSFAPVVGYSTGSLPEDITSADYNGDGHIDLATANTGADSISVLYGSASGTFAPAVYYYTGQSPKKILSKDINGDGRPDLLVSNYGTSSNMAVLLNNNSTFAAAITYSTDPGPYGLVVTDLNGDAKPDIVSANSAGQSLSVWLNHYPVIVGPASPSCAGTAVTLTASAQGLASVSWNINGLNTPVIAVSPTTNTTYVATITNTLAGCTATAAFMISTLPLPSVSAVSSSTLLCIGQSASLAASGAVSYNWSNGSTATVVTVQPIATTVYTLSGTGSNGCTAKVTITEMVSACTGITGNSSGETGLRVFPNPANSVVQLLYDNNSSSELELHVYNALGVEIHNSTISGQNTTIDLSQHPAGVYLYSVMSNGKPVRQGKLILNR